MGFWLPVEKAITSFLFLLLQKSLGIDKNFCKHNLFLFIQINNMSHCELDNNNFLNCMERTIKNIRIKNKYSLKVVTMKAGTNLYKAMPKNIDSEAFMKQNPGVPTYFTNLETATTYANNSAYGGGLYAFTLTQSVDLLVMSDHTNVETLLNIWENEDEYPIRGVKVPETLDEYPIRGVKVPETRSSTLGKNKLKPNEREEAINQFKFMMGFQQKPEHQEEMLQKLEKVYKFILPRSHSEQRSFLNRCSVDVVDRTLAVSICKLLKSVNVVGYVSNPIFSTFVEERKQNLFHPEIVLCNAGDVVQRTIWNVNDYMNLKNLSEYAQSVSESKDDEIEDVSEFKTFTNKTVHLNRIKETPLEKVHHDALRYLLLSKTSSWNKDRQFFNFTDDVLEAFEMAGVEYNEQMSEQRKKRSDCIKLSNNEQTCTAAPSCTWRNTSTPMLYNLLMKWPNDKYTTQADREEMVTAYLNASGLSDTFKSSVLRKMKKNPTWKISNWIRNNNNANNGAVPSHPSVCVFTKDNQTFNKGAVITLPVIGDKSIKIPRNKFTVMGFQDVTTENLNLHCVVYHKGGLGSAANNIVVVSRPFVINKNLRIGVGLVCGTIMEGKNNLLGSCVRQLYTQLNNMSNTNPVISKVMENNFEEEGRKIIIKGKLKSSLDNINDGIGMFKTFVDAVCKLLFQETFFKILASLYGIRGATVTFTGFSLGALITHINLFLCNIFLKPLFPSIHFNAVAFGAPRSGNTVYADMFSSYDHLSLVNGVNTVVPKYTDSTALVNILPEVGRRTLPIDGLEIYLQYDDLTLLPPASKTFANVEPTILADGKEFRNVTADIRSRSYMNSETSCSTAILSKGLEQLRSERRSQLPLVDRLVQKPSVRFALQQLMKIGNILGYITRITTNEVVTGLHNYDSYSDSIRGKVWFHKIDDGSGEKYIEQVSFAEVPSPHVHDERPIGIMSYIAKIPWTVYTSLFGQQGSTRFQVLNRNRQRQLDYLERILNAMTPDNRKTYAKNFYETNNFRLEVIYPELKTRFRGMFLNPELETGNADNRPRKRRTRNADNRQNRPTKRRTRNDDNRPTKLLRNADNRHTKRRKK